MKAQTHTEPVCTAHHTEPLCIINNFSKILHLFFYLKKVPLYHCSFLHYRLQKNIKYMIREPLPSAPFILFGSTLGGSIVTAILYGVLRQK